MSHDKFKFLYAFSVLPGPSCSLFRIGVTTDRVRTSRELKRDHPEGRIVEWSSVLDRDGQAAVTMLEILMKPYLVDRHLYEISEDSVASHLIFIQHLMFLRNTKNDMYEASHFMSMLWERGPLQPGEIDDREATKSDLANIVLYPPVRSWEA